MGSILGKHLSDEAELGTKYGVVLSPVCSGVTGCGLCGHMKGLFSWFVEGEPFVVTIGQVELLVFSSICFYILTFLKALDNQPL